MSDIDYYCALCGSTFSNSHIAIRPHSARLRQAFRSSQAKQQAFNADGAGDSKSDCRSAAEQNESDSPIDDDEMHTYDPSIISKEDARWVFDLQCLGISPATEGPRKGFISAIAYQSTHGVIEVVGHDDRDPFGFHTFSAYCDTTDPSAIVYPFHPKCWDLFQITLEYQSSGRRPLPVISIHSWIPLLETVSNIDKAALFDIMNGDGKGHVRRLTGIDYGEPNPPNEPRWKAKPGEEVFLADPTQEREDVKATIADVWSSLTRICPKSSPNPPPEIHKGDPFSRLPYELLSMIASELEISSLIDLANASPHVHRVSIENPLLWLKVMRSSMPWFFELQQFLDSYSNPSTMKGFAEVDPNSLRLLCLWANNITTPRIGKTGLFMGVANRRRIWGICRQLTDMYSERLEH